MGIYFFLFLAAPALYGTCLFYLRLGRKLAGWGKAWVAAFGGHRRQASR